MKTFYKFAFIALLAATVFTACSKSGADNVADFSSAGGAAGNGTGGSLARFTIVGNYMYVVDNTSLHVFNISNPAATAKVSTVAIGFNIETIYPYTDKLFIGSSNGMFIYSLTNPAVPSRISSVAHFTSCDPVVANDTVAYVTLRGGNTCGSTNNLLVVYDIRNIQAPVEVRNIGLNGPYGLGYSGNALYVCDGGRLVVYNINNSNNPQYVQAITSNGAESYYDVIPYGNTLICYLNKGVSFYDISNRLQPVFLSKLVN